MKGESPSRQTRQRSQAIFYVTIGLANMAFVMLFLAPRAESQRDRAAEIAAVGSAAPAIDNALAGSAHANTGSATEVGAARDDPSGSAAMAGAATGPAVSDTAGTESATAAAPTVPSGSAVADAGTPGSSAATTDDPAGSAMAAAAPPPTASEPSEVQPAQPPRPIPASITIHFGNASATVPAAERGRIKRAASILSDDPTLVATLVGHADQRGNADENSTLSEARAASVADALARLGVDAERLASQGVGSTAPMDAGETPTAYSRNRRVEIKFARKESP